MKFFQGDEWSHLRALHGWIPGGNTSLPLNGAFQQTAAVCSLGRGPSINHTLQSVKKWIFGMLPWDALANLHPRELLGSYLVIQRMKDKFTTRALRNFSRTNGPLITVKLFGDREKIVSKVPWARNAFQENLKHFCNLIPCEGFRFKPESSKTRDYELKAYSNFRAVERDT